MKQGIEFQTVDKEQIKVLLEKELKGKPFEETLYSPMDGVLLDPIYTTQETPKNTWVSPNVDYRINFQSFSLDGNAQEVNTALLEALTNGVSGIILNYRGDNSALRFSDWFKDVRFDYIYTHLAMNIEAFDNAFRSYLETLNYIVEPHRIFSENTAVFGGSFFISSSKFVLDAVKLLKSIESKATLPSIVFVEMSGDYFLDIAKLRALKIIVNGSMQLMENHHEILFIGQSNEDNKTIEKVENNILRASTEAMAALIASADGVWIKPFDFKKNPSNEFSLRISRNIFNILIEESYIDKVIDPSSGSYYIEHYTKQIAKLIYNNM